MNITPQKQREEFYNFLDKITETMRYADSHGWMSNTDLGYYLEHIINNAPIDNVVLVLGAKEVEVVNVSD